MRRMFGVLWVPSLLLFACSNALPPAADSQQRDDAAPDARATVDGQVVPDSKRPADTTPAIDAAGADSAVVEAGADSAAVEAGADSAAGDSNVGDGATDATSDAPDDLGGDATICSGTATKPCYTGDPATLGKGLCRAGKRSCINGKWGPCQSQVLPKPEVCDTEDNDCDGYADEAIARTACSVIGKLGNCAAGLTTCTKGRFVCAQVVFPAKETCDNKDESCSGKIDDGVSRDCFTGSSGCTLSSTGTYTCKGICKAGTQLCSAGKWQVCASQVLPRLEVCDGKDNDCNGRTDENFPSKGCAVVGQLGPCAAGRTRCTNGKIVCAQVVFAKAETCNNIDDNCDNKIDNGVTRPCYTGRSGCTASSGGTYTCQGECKTGTQACAAGKWQASCSNQIFPRTEICRDTKDNDCDGKADEICGPQYVYAAVNAAGTLMANRGIASSAKTATGTYSVAPTSLQHGCDIRPIFVSASTTSMRPVAVNCKKRTFQITTGAHATRTSQLQDWSFYAVVPAKTAGAVFGVVTGTTLTKSRSYGTFSVTRAVTGVFDVATSVCNSATQPVFANVYGALGYATAYYLSAGKCRVRTYDVTGVPANRTFGFWIPNRNNAAYAIVSNTGTIYASNYFGDQTARWTSRLVISSKGTYTSTEVLFPAWSTRSVAIATPRIGAPYDSPVSPLSGGFRSSIRHVPDASLKAIHFSVLFVQ